MTNSKDIDLLHLGPEIKVMWLGNLSWVISSSGRMIATDLDLNNELRIKPSPVSAEMIAPHLDLLFITHEHEDHFSSKTCSLLKKHSDCMFVLPVNCLKKARRLGIPASRIIRAIPGQSIIHEEIEADVLKAVHGHKDYVIYSGACMDDCGYKIIFGGRTFLQPGDSVLMEDHLNSGKSDILFVSPTEHNMHIRSSLQFIKGITPDWIFPQHFGTYRIKKENKFWTKGYPRELKNALPLHLQKKYHILKIGGSRLIDRTKSS